MPFHANEDIFVRFVTRSGWWNSGNGCVKKSSKPSITVIYILWYVMYAQNSTIRAKSIVGLNEIFCKVWFGNRNIFALPILSKYLRIRDFLISRQIIILMQIPSIQRSKLADLWRKRWIQGIALPKFPRFSAHLARSSPPVTVSASASFLASALYFGQRVFPTTSRGWIWIDTQGQILLYFFHEKRVSIKFWNW